MTNKKEAAQMRRFINDKLERKNYKIKQETEWGTLVTRPEEEPTVVFIHTGLESNEDMQRRKNVVINISEYRHAHIIYGDGKKVGLVRLGQRGNTKLTRSLKHHTKKEIDSMIHKRQREKDLDTGTGLTYYRPETTRTPERLEHLLMTPATLDYTHLNRHSHGYGFARSGTSQDYFLTGTEWVVYEGGIILVPRGRRADIKPEII